MQFFRQQSAGCYCSMDRMDTLEGKVQGRCNKIFSLSQHPACQNSPRKNNIQMLFTLGLILIVSSLSQLSAWPPGCSPQHPPCSCTPCALSFPLSARLKRAGRERWGIWDGDGTHEPCFRQGVLYSKGVCENRMHWEHSKQPGGKTKYAKDICSKSLGKNYQRLSNVMLLISLPHTSLAAPGCALITFPS